jgi:hypothetical protein
MRYRENILKALAALVPFKDEYRKAICEHGVVPYIIDALKPRPSDALADAAMPRNTAEDGNPIPTILAACGTARMLTRSVSVLRTSLIDAGVAKPLFALLRHSDLEVQIAATAAICNLALDFSPMKEVCVSISFIDFAANMLFFSGNHFPQHHSRPLRTRSFIQHQITD